MVPLIGMVAGAAELGLNAETSATAGPANPKESETVACETHG